MIRVLIADDQTLVRDGFASIINREPDLTVVGQAADGRAAIDQTRKHRPQVVLMDIRMPHTDGLHAARVLLADPDPPRVLMLTTFDLDEYVYEALRSGASGFLLKDVRSGELVEAIRTVAAGDQLLSPAITKRLIEQHLKRPQPGTRPASLETLTDRELDVLNLLGRGLSNAEISLHLHLGTSTVKTHVNRILGKLSIRDRAQAVVYAYETGLIQPGEHSALQRRPADS